MNFCRHHFGWHTNGGYIEFSPHGTYTLDDAQPMVPHSATPLPAVSTQVYESSLHEKWPKHEKSARFGRRQERCKNRAETVQQAELLVSQRLATTKIVAQQVVWLRLATIGYKLA